jgi:hypothetical protein
LSGISPAPAQQAISSAHAIGCIEARIEWFPCNLKEIGYSDVGITRVIPRK